MHDATRLRACVLAGGLTITEYLDGRRVAQSLHG